MLLKYSHLQPSEMDKLPFFELEELIDSLKMLNEKEEEERKKSEGSAQSQMPNLNMSSLQRQMNSAATLPKLPNFKL